MKYPDWTNDKIVKEILFYYEDAGHLLLVMNRDLSPYFEGFVGFPPGEEFLIISEDVPEHYRAPMLIHEITKQKLPDEEGRSICALQKETNYVIVEDFMNYRLYRLDFFERLVAWALTMAGEQGLAVEAQSCVEYLREQSD